MRELVHRTGLPLSDEIGLTAAAQHYGIPTDLLDLSMDPSISISFANQKPDEGTQGTLFVITFAKLSNRFDLRLILPPPFVERVYIQRGLFVRFDYDRAAQFRQLCIELRFEKHPEFCVIRNQQKLPHETVLQDDGFLQALAEQCLEWARLGNRWRIIKDGEEHVRRTIEEFFASIPEDLSKSMYRDGIGMWAHHSAVMFEGLAMGRVDGKLQRVDNVVELLVQDCPKLAVLLSSFYYGQASEARQQLNRIRRLPWNWRGSDTERRFCHAYESARVLSSYLADVAAGLRIPKVAVDTWS